MDAVERLSIPKGPLLAQLKAGRSVTLPNGSVVETSQVVEAPRPGRTHLHLGDTCDSRNAMLIAKGADWLVHESTFDDANQVGIAYFDR
jgi:ribonuclease Z